MRNEKFKCLCRATLPSCRKTWTLKPLYPALTNSTGLPRLSPVFGSPQEERQQTRANEENHQTTDACKDDTRQLTPSKDFDSIQTPTWMATQEANLQMALLALKVNEPTISSTEIPHSKIQPKRASTIESPQESPLMVFSATSIRSFSFGLSSKKN